MGPGTLFILVFLFGGGGGNLVPRRDKGSFYILKLVPGSRGGTAEGGQVDVWGYLLFYY